ncbi:complement C5-like [Arvicola amphibius]|uniref:complement C5-like n=1 Tax=Arvicola amphibius TaxID=1047088 RepID=UPI0018E375F2|nr:complement C5-like [Arvicola amphibius]
MPLPAMGLWGALCFLIFLGKTWGQEETYVISAPKVFQVGASENVVIQAHGYKEAFDATISIRSYPDKKVTYSSGYVNLSPENKFQNSAMLTIQPSQLPGEQSPVSHVYLEIVSKHFSKSKKMPLTYDNGFLFIHTDKPVYTPDQSVKVRVYSLNDDLKPSKRETVLTFIDPEGSEVDIVEENDYTGIISFPDFKIPPNPKYGVWTIKAKYKKDFSTTGTTNFEIKEYVLPRFSVSIEPESNFISYKNFKNFEITVTARYFYNKVVSDADVYVFFGLKEDIKEDQKEMMQKAMQVTRLINGVARLTFDSETAVKELSYESLEDLHGKYLYIAVTVTEASGGFSEEADLPGIKYVISPYTLNLVATPLFLKPGIPFSIKVQVKDSLDQLVGGIPVILTAQTVDENQDTSDLEPKRSVTHATDGVAPFVVNLPSEVTALNFNVKTDVPELPEENQASKEYQAITYSSLSQSYIYIAWTENYKPMLVGEFLNIIVTPKSPYIDKITHYNYLILSKGKIVQYGTKEKLLYSSYQNINIPVTQDMVPSARLLVYYIVTGEQTAELVADSVWINVEEKCGNQLQVHLSPDADVYSPGQTVSLEMVTEADSWVALAAVDSAVYRVQERIKRPMQRVFRAFDKHDLGCGAGGGRNNADVFHLAGLTFLTNANADDSQQHDESCEEILRPKRDVQILLQKKIEEQAAKYKHRVPRKCCLDGARHNMHETCAQRVARVTIGPNCVRAFNECCIIATKIRQEGSLKHIQLGRMHIKTLLPAMKADIRSYFPESWLWEVHHVPKRNQLQVVLPDSLTTWEVQGISISDSGICVADTLKAKVLKDVFLEMNIPYSVVRGEQIQLKGTVYNYRTLGTMFCVRMSAAEGICTSGGSTGSHQGSKSSRCVRQSIEGSSTHLVTFSLLPLEIGLHSINFSLETSFGREILVKTLRVVPEGVKRESYAGVTLDPKGVYGIANRRKEFPYRIPLDLVPKTSVKRILSVKGLLIGEFLSTVLSKEGIDILTHLPRGSAEAEIMSIVPVFYVFHYLEAGSHWNLFYPDSLARKQSLQKKIKEGLVSISSYRNSDYSYSMWKGGSASTWLTAFALRVLGQVAKYMKQDQNSICNSLLWLVEKCQLENGSFQENSQYLPIKLQGTLPVEAQENALYITAFSVIGIRKAMDICPLMKIDTALTKADSFLLAKALTSKSTFTLAIVAYALSLGDKTHPQFRSIVTALKREASVKGDPPIYRFWKDTRQRADSPGPNSGTAGMVETTAYALLTCLNLKETYYVNPIIKWLSEEQRYGGGFYSTQDTINAIEGLTEYSLLAKQLYLNMDINVSYKHKGDFYHYKVTEKNFLGRPVEVPLNDDLVITTGYSNGLATVHVKTVVHKTSVSEEFCSFHLKIDTQDIDASSNPSLSDSGHKHVVACASYKASKGESASGSSHAVMDISLPTGIGANQEDLRALVEGVDQLLTDYQIKDGHVILQLNSIPSRDFLCVRFRIFELFQVGFLNPATFTVYEYHRPDKQCTMFYSTSDSRLQRVCEGAACQCVEADCGQLQAELDLSISADKRKETACKPEIAYAYKVRITSTTEENVFVKYTATLLDIYKTGEAAAEKDSEITFIRKMSCGNAALVKGKQYLVMGKEALQIKHNFSFKYIYPLDSSTWIEYWPTDTKCPSCPEFVANLEEFAEDIFLSGCESA